MTFANKWNGKNKYQTNQTIDLITICDVQLLFQSFSEKEIEKRDRKKNEIQHFFTVYGISDCRCVSMIIMRLSATPSPFVLLLVLLSHAHISISLTIHMKWIEKNRFSEVLIGLSNCWWPISTGVCSYIIHIIASFL